MQGLILYAHGARDPNWAEPVRGIACRLAAARPDCLVQEAYLEHTAPDLVQAVAFLRERGATSLTLVPLFLGRGGHLLHDFPARVREMRAANPDLSFEVLPSLGEAAEVLDGIAGWVASAVPRVAAGT